MKKGGNRGNFFYLLVLAHIGNNAKPDRGKYHIFPSIPISCFPLGKAFLLRTFISGEKTLAKKTH